MPRRLARGLESAQLHQASIGASQPDQVGFEFTQQHRAGFDASELHQAGSGFKQPRQACLASMRCSGVTRVFELTLLHHDGSGAWPLFDAGLICPRTWRARESAKWDASRLKRPAPPLSPVVVRR